LFMACLFLAPLRALEEVDGFDTDDNSCDQCGILVESEVTFSEDCSLDESFYVEFSMVSSHIELIDPIFDVSSLDLSLFPPI